MYLVTESATSLLNSDEVKQQVKIQSPAAQTANRFPLVLIADEDDDTRLMMKYLLSLWNYRVVEAANDDEIVQTAKDERPDLILISDKFSRIDGIATIRRIRESSELDGTTIIFINGYAEPSVQEAALAVGANDFMTKPIDFGRLETKLDQYLRKDEKLTRRSENENL